MLPTPISAVTTESNGASRKFPCCRSEEADSVASAHLRGKLTQQYPAEEAAEPQEHPCTADSSSITSSKSVQPHSLPETPALERQSSEGAYAPVARNMRSKDSAAAGGVVNSAISSGFGSEGVLELSGVGWTIPITLKGVSLLPDEGASVASLPDQAQCQPQCDDSTLQAHINEATSECSSYLSTANALQLSGQGWAMPLRLHGRKSETSEVPEEARKAPKQALAIKPGPAQECLNSQEDTADAGCEYHIRPSMTLLHCSCKSV